ncbi:MAG: hypothetical protein NTW50_00705 [Candidatus Berkelbacteria bacterium]|nr:hypothetical protein [Candidatus Berkelbacteria bacterium]
MRNTEFISGFLFGIAEGSEIIPARILHHDRYLKAGYISTPSPSGMIEDEYVSNSIYFTCIESATSKTVGVIRLIFRTLPSNFPCLSEFNLYSEDRQIISSLDLSTTVEIGSLAEHPGYKIAEGLYRFTWQYSKWQFLSYWFGSIDSRLLKYYLRRGFPWKIIGEPRVYMGSETTPVMLDLAVLPNSLSQKSPRLFDYMEGTKPTFLYRSL